MDNFAFTTQQVLDSISRHCPEAMSLYLQCINRADEEGHIHFTKPLVEIDMSEDWNKFKKNVKKLALENLLEWSPLDGGISVTLMELDE